MCVLCVRERGRCDIARSEIEMKYFFFFIDDDEEKRVKNEYDECREISLSLFLFRGSCDEGGGNFE